MCKLSYLIQSTEKPKHDHVLGPFSGSMHEMPLKVKPLELSPIRYSDFVPTNGWRHFKLTEVPTIEIVIMKDKLYLQFVYIWNSMIPSRTFQNRKNLKKIQQNSHFDISHQPSEYMY